MRVRVARTYLHTLDAMNGFRQSRTTNMRKITEEKRDTNDTDVYVVIKEKVRAT